MSEKMQCPKCEQTVRLRKDGALSKHKRYRHWGTRGPMDQCSWSGKPLTWVAKQLAVYHSTTCLCSYCESTRGVLRRLYG
jgi:hypothetical protein